MATALKKVEKIRQIVRLKQAMIRWKLTSLLRKPPVLSSTSESDDASSLSPRRRRAPSGFLAVYVGSERRRFVIPARFVNLPVFVALLEKAAEEFGFECSGGLVLPCEVSFFRSVLKFLERDEGKFGKLALKDFFKIAADVTLADSCKAAKAKSSPSFAPLLQKARGQKNVTTMLRDIQKERRTSLKSH